MRARQEDIQGGVLPGIVQVFNGLQEKRDLWCLVCGMRFVLNATPGVLTTIGFCCLRCFDALFSAAHRITELEVMARIEMAERKEPAEPWTPFTGVLPRPLELIEPLEPDLTRLRTPRA